MTAVPTLVTPSLTRPPPVSHLQGHARHAIECRPGRAPCQPAQHSRPLASLDLCLSVSLSVPLSSASQSASTPLSKNPSHSLCLFSLSPSVSQSLFLSCIGARGPRGGALEATAFLQTDQCGSNQPGPGFHGPSRIGDRPATTQ